MSFGTVIGYIEDRKSSCKSDSTHRILSASEGMSSWAADSETLSVAARISAARAACENWERMNRVTQTGSNRNDDGLTWISLAPMERNRSVVSLWKSSRISCVTWDGSVSAASSSFLALEDARSMANCELRFSSCISIAVHVGAAGQIKSEIYF